MADLCLGTVQFGMKYGINNRQGQPSMNDSVEMIKYAVDNGVKYIDTARAYGDAELVIGEYNKIYGVPKDIKIISKLRPNIIEADTKDVNSLNRDEFESSLKRMGVDKLNGYLLHTPEYIYNQNILDALLNLKEEKMVENIGVSIYDLKEGEQAIKTGIIDYIQLPYSYLDQRGIRTGFIKKAKEHGIKIFTRSAFLQGLVMMEKSRIPQYLAPAICNIEKFELITKEFNEDIINAIIHFVTDEADIDYLVFGVDNIEQLKEDMDAYRNKKINTLLIEQVKQHINMLEDNIIFPSLWSNGKKAEWKSTISEDEFMLQISTKKVTM